MILGLVMHLLLEDTGTGNNIHAQCLDIYHVRASLCSPKLTLQLQ
jgi:hypothetical protein